MEAIPRVFLCTAPALCWSIDMLDDGRKMTKELFRSVLNEELAKIKTQIGEKRFASGKFDVARELFDRITTDDEFAEFLTLPGYEKLD